MTEWLNVSAITPRVSYVAAGGQTAFTVPFVFFEEADLFVYKNGTLLTLAVDYTTTGAESASGGTITLLVGATVSDVILIVRTMEIAQTTHIPPSGPLDVPAINIQISKLIAIDQQLQNGLDRSFRLPDNVGGALLAITAPVAGQYLKWNTTANGVESAAVVTPPGGFAIATQSEAEAGTLNTSLMTPLRTTQARQAAVATQAQAVAGVSNTVVMTPLSVAQAIPMFNALQYGIVGDGSANDAAAINTFFTTCITAGAIAYFPGKTYDCGATSLTLPDNSIVLCHPSATFRRSANGASRSVYSVNTGALINIGSNCRWANGTFTNTAVIGTSTSSVAVGTATGTRVFTVAAGLPLVNGDFVRVYNTANPINYVEGTAAYSGTTLTVTVTFVNGTGTFTAWSFVWGAVFQAAVCLQNASASIVDGITVTGLFYTGLLMAADKTVNAAWLSTKHVITRCYAKGILNRAFYIYGSATQIKFSDCHVDGNAGQGDYGFNINPANSGANPNSVLRTEIVNCTSDNTSFQGFTLGDKTFYTTISNCIASNILSTAAEGFEVILANGFSPQFNNISNCIAQASNGDGFGLFGALYTTLSNISAISCGGGIRIDASAGINSSENAINDFLVTGCSGTGVLLGTGSINTMVYGRSTANGTNYTNNGTGTTGSATVT